jgi:hypothetical protein
VCLVFLPARWPEGASWTWLPANRPEVQGDQQSRVLEGRSVLQGLRPTVRKSGPLVGSDGAGTGSAANPLQGSSDRRPEALEQAP